MSVFGVILVHIFPSISRIRTEYGEILRISLYSVQMRENAGKKRTRITPNADTFYVVLLTRVPRKITALQLKIFNKRKLHINENNVRKV